MRTAKQHKFEYSIRSWVKLVVVHVAGAELFEYLSLLILFVMSLNVQFTINAECAQPRLQIVILLNAL